MSFHGSSLSGITTRCNINPWCIKRSFLKYFLKWTKSEFFKNCNAALLRQVAEVIRHHWGNSLRPNDTIRRHTSGSTLAQIVASCLMAPSHYLNQCWLIISKVLYHSSEDLIKRRLWRYQSVKQAWKLNLYICIQIPQGPMSKYMETCTI